MSGGDAGAGGRDARTGGGNDGAGAARPGGGFGLVVGSGLGRLDLEVTAREPVQTPYGPASSAVLTVEIGGRAIPCIARHGEAHSIAPGDVNYRANVWALHRAGVRRLVAVNVVGTIAPDFAPGQLAVPEQLIDYTWGRASTFASGEGSVVHVEFTQPFDTGLCRSIARAAAECGTTTVGGVYGVTQGPRLETAAEIDRLERDGCTMVGMTAMPEAALARELDMRYAVLAAAVNYAAGRAPGGAPIHGQIERYLAVGMGHVAKLLPRLVVRDV